MKKIIVKVLSAVSALAGLAILAWVLAPIISYQVSSGDDPDNYISPVPYESEYFKSVKKVDSGGNAPILQIENYDLTKASNWFNDNANFEDDRIGYYNISIPKLGIDNATAAIGGEDLSKSLIHYPGTARPGESGNAVVFGHSILPQFYDPEDYMAIFSTLPTLEVGDSIYVKYDGISYKYRVEDMFEVKPTDIQILQQDPTDSFLTLVTCVPPGHPLRPKRLVVRARVVPLGSANADISN